MGLHETGSNYIYAYLVLSLPTVYMILILTRKTDRQTDRQM